MVSEILESAYHLDIRSEDREIASQRIDFDLRERNALRKIVKHWTREGRRLFLDIDIPGIPNVGGLVESVCRKIDTIKVRSMSKLRHRRLGSKLFAIGLKTL